MTCAGKVSLTVTTPLDGVELTFCTEIWYTPVPPGSKDDGRLAVLTYHTGLAADAEAAPTPIAVAIIKKAAAVAILVD